MKRALLILLAALLALPLAAVAAAHWYLGGEAVRARVAEAVRRATGRELTIAGPVRLAWSLTPTLEARDVSLSNPPGFSRPDMAHVDRVRAPVALLALLRGRVEVGPVVLAGLDVLLERDAQGRPNWAFAPPAPAPSAQPSAPSGGTRLTFVVDEIEVQNARVGWLGPPLLRLAAPRLAYSPGKGGVAGELLVNSVRLALTGTAGPIEGAAWPLELQLAGGGVTASLAGTSAQAGLTVRAADLSAASALAGAALPPVRDLQAAAQVSLAAGAVALHGLRLTSAQGDVSGDLAVSFGARPSLRGALTSQRLVLDALVPQPLTAASPVPSGPAPAAPAAPRSERVIPDTTLPFGALRGGDADLRLTLAEAVWHGRSYRAVQAHAVLQDGRLRLDPASMAVGSATVVARLLADAAAQPPALSVSVQAPGLAAGPALALFGGPPDATGTLDVRAELRARGGTLRALAASLDGHAGLALVDGEIGNGWLEGVLAGALRAARLPLDASGSSKVRCAAIRAEASGGRVQLRALTLDTSKLKLDGSGGINLGDETLDLHLRPQLRLGTALSVPLRIGGTLGAPKAALDPGAIAPGRVGIVLGGPAPEDACGPALALARDGQAGPAPPPPAPQASHPMKPADLLRSLLR